MKVICGCFLYAYGKHQWVFVCYGLWQTHFGLSCMLRHAHTLSHSSSYAAATLFFILLILWSILMHSHLTLPFCTYLPQIPCTVIWYWYFLYIAPQWSGTDTSCILLHSCVFYSSCITIFLFIINLCIIGRARKKAFHGQAYTCCIRGMWQIQFCSIFKTPRMLEVYRSTKYSLSIVKYGFR